ncbi:unnamed protein product, partial [Didymodactylos carnosus]
MEVPALGANLFNMSNYSENIDSNGKMDDQQQKTPEYLTNGSASTVIPKLTQDVLNSSEKTKTADRASGLSIPVDVVSIMPAAQLDQEEEPVIEDNQVGKE